MDKRPKQSIKRALISRKQALLQASYPGDLANDILKDHSHVLSGRRLFPLATAATTIGLGTVIGMLILQDDSTSRVVDPIAHIQPNEFEPEQETRPPVMENIQTHPSATSTKAGFPEIDRSLLPLKRVGTSTWLSSPVPHKQQLDKQSQFAQHPSPSKRLRTTLSPPNRRAIDRTLTRPLNLKPAPKTERTS